MSLQSFLPTLPLPINTQFKLVKWDICVSFAYNSFARLLLAAFLMSCFVVIISATKDTDRLALLALKAGITSDPFGLLNSWNDSTDFCQWYGVRCSHRHHRVTILDLNSQRLSGPISPHIGNLNFLKVLSLENNSFCLGIPSQMGRLRQLQLLDLSNNSQTSEIPRNISGCSTLVYISIWYNQLVGGIPVELGSLSHLQWFVFTANQLTGSIPSSIRNLSSWEAIFCGNNGLSGIIPQSVGRLTKLKYLSLGANGLLGTIPPLVFNLSSLIKVDVSRNRICGNLPEDIGLTLSNLQVFSIFDYQFTGSIPSSIPNRENCQKSPKPIGWPASSDEGCRPLHEGHDALAGGQRGSRPPSDRPPLLAASPWSVRGRRRGSRPQRPGRGRGLGAAASPRSGRSRLAQVSARPPGAVTLAGDLAQTRARPGGRGLAQVWARPPGAATLAGNLAQTRARPPGAVTLASGHAQTRARPPARVAGLTGAATLAGRWRGLCGPRAVAVLYLSQNELSGKVPSLANLHNIESVFLYFNHLESGGSNADDLSFLCSLTNAANLMQLGVLENKFGGMLPLCIGNFSATLEVLTLSSNTISGEIPREIGNLVNLQILQIDYNLLSGPIPSHLGNLSNLAVLTLAGNYLSSIIPSSLQNMQNLISLYLDINNFEGPIPSYLEKYQSLTFLHLGSNNLSGPIVFPTTGSLLYLNLSRNHMSGVLPMEIGNLKHLDTLDVSGNILEGEIPSSIGNCDGLTVLRLRDNVFHGSIPQPISSLRSIEELDLSNNSFYGEIPKFLEAFQFLEKLNLSYNHLEGLLPTQGVFRNVSATFVVGNEKLCGGMPKFELPDCVSRNSKSSHKLKLTVAVVFGLLGITLIATFLYLCWLKQKRNEPISSYLDVSLLNLSYGTLLKATYGFSSTNLIGAGSFGSVYKGLLQENGNVIVVKVLNLMRYGALKSFKAECEALRCIKHRNLLKVLTGDEFKALIYEFMVNGSLEEWLHPNSAPNDVDGYSKKLSLVQRINISIDIASALDYLHNQCESPIIHCDLKPSNVLLDVDMVGHVGDFGLAKIVLESTFDTRASLSFASLRGTVGYIAPEYANGSKVSREGDIYSYGVLLLEMFTGLSPTSDMFRDELNLRNYIAEALPQRAMEITDPVLLHEGESHNSFQDSLRERNRIFQECLETIYHVGLACSMEEPRRRMSIDKVANQLHLIRKKLFAASLLEARIDDIEMLFANEKGKNNSIYTKRTSAPLSSTRLCSLYGSIAITVSSCFVDRIWFPRLVRQLNPGYLSRTTPHSTRPQTPSNQQSNHRQVQPTIRGRFACDLTRYAIPCTLNLIQCKQCNQQSNSRFACNLTRYAIPCTLNLIQCKQCNQQSNSRFACNLTRATTWPRCNGATAPFLRRGATMPFRAIATALRGATVPFHAIATALRRPSSVEAQPCPSVQAEALWRYGALPPQRRNRALPYPPRRHGATAPFLRRGATVPFRALPFHNLR
ncbi:hypothetical protein BT93_F2121 [Corymbia citriodora subsp. variegata]|nr:hypothetical protein BT93_F2121 [Corymbia citriodora subsp. variegata]